MVDAYPFHCDTRAVADPDGELSIQVRFRSRARMVMPRVRIVAVPNAGKRGMKAIAKVKAEGMSKGFPDTICLWPGTTAFIEFKPRDGHLEPEQIDWLNWLHAGGYPCGMFRSVDTAIDFLLAHGAPSLTGMVS